jgi:hypothetical protein
MDYTLWGWAKRLLSGQPHVRIHPGEYLDRWHLLPRNRFCNVYLHKFYGGDPGRNFHDHPWWNVSLILKGEIWEKHPIGGYGPESPYCLHGHDLRRRGDIVVRKATDCHTLEWVGDRTEPVWTLFITGPRVREWGFWEDGKWVPWEEYYRKHNLTWD